MFKYNNQDFKLHFDMNALCLLETLTKTSTVDLVSGPGFQTVRASVYSGLKSQIPDLTIEEAGIIIDGYIKSGQSFKSLNDEVTRLIEEALGMQEKALNQKASVQAGKRKPSQ